MFRPLRVCSREIAPVLDVIQSRPVQIRAAANEKRQCFGDGLEHVRSSLSCRNLRIGRKWRNLRQEVARDFSLNRAIEKRSLFRIFLAPRLKILFPTIVLGQEIFLVLCEKLTGLFGNEIALVRQA